MVITLQFLMLQLFWSVVMSFAEHWVHKHIMHGRTVRLRKWFPNTYVLHAVEHHRNYYEQFDHEPDERGRWLNIHFGLWPGLPISVLIGLAGIPLFGWLNLTAVMSVVGLHHTIWNAFHEEMHIPQKRFFSNWRWYKYIRFYHWMHHRYPGKNYNVVFPLADFILGTHMKPSARDLEAASRL